ncbi:MAG: hypothetical protein ACRCXZ_01465 [Patescibacteria group bacterium]
MQFNSFTFSLLVIFLPIVIMIYSMGRVNHHDRLIHDMKKLSKELLADKTQEDIEATLKLIAKKAKEMISSGLFDKGTKGNEELALIKSKIDEHNEQQYAYTKSEKQEQAPTALNVIEIGKLEFQIRELLDKLIKYEEGTVGTHVLLIIFWYIISNVVKNEIFRA